MDAGASGLKPETPEFCRLMVQASPMPMAFVIGDQHVIRCVNDAFRRVVGAVSRELVGELFSNAVPCGYVCRAALDRVHGTGNPETFTAERKSSYPFQSFAVWPIVDCEGIRVGCMLEVTHSVPASQKMLAMNEALLLGSVRQHELAESTRLLNAQLQESELRLRSLIEAIPQIVWTATPTGKLDFANSRWFESLGMDLDTFNASGWSTLLHPDDQDRALEEWTRVVRTGSVFQLEHRSRHLASETWRWYYSRAVPLYGASETVTKWFGTTTDIDERKRAEIAGFATQKQESLGVLAGGIAHDFNNLLGVILGNASLMELKLPASHPLQANIGEITGASERAAHLTRQMLAYAGKGRFLIEPTDISRVVERIYQRAEASRSPKVSFSVQTRSNLPPAQADASQIEQVVANLAQNAIEAVNESGGGRVVVKTDIVEMSADAIAKRDWVVGAVQPGTYVVIEVADNGCGMDTGIKSRMLEPFFTTKFTGRGLGLAAVAGILRGHGGCLEVETASGKGSTFRAYFPISMHAVKKPEISSRYRKVRDAGAILIVDDEEMIRRVAVASLEQAGFTVLAAGGGAAALELLQSERASPISLMILDMSMPEMNGRQVMEAVRRLGIDIPILVCSGYSEAEVIREFSGLDITGFVQKPFTAKLLTSQVREALNRAQRNISCDI